MIESTPKRRRQPDYKSVAARAQRGVAFAGLSIAEVEFDKYTVLATAEQACYDRLAANLRAWSKLSTEIQQDAQQLANAQDKPATTPDRKALDNQDIYVLRWYAVAPRIVTDAAPSLTEALTSACRGRLSRRGLISFSIDDADRFLVSITEEGRAYLREIAEPAKVVA